MYLSMSVCMYVCMQKTIKPFVKHTKNGHGSSCQQQRVQIFSVILSVMDPILNR